MQKEDKTYRFGCNLIKWWSGINLFLSFLILFVVATGIGNSPLFSMVFTKNEVLELPDKVIKAMNCLTILYNSYAVAMSIVVWFIVNKGLKNKEVWAYFAILISIGIATVFSFIATAPFNFTRWQVNVVLALLFLVGITLTGKDILAKNHKA